MLVLIAQHRKTKCLLDETEYRGEIHHIPVYEVRPSVRGDEDERDTRTETNSAPPRRGHMVVKSPEIVPGDDDCGASPLWASHDGVNLPDGPVLTQTHGVRRVLADT